MSASENQGPLPEHLPAPSFSWKEYDLISNSQYQKQGNNIGEGASAKVFACKSVDAADTKIYAEKRLLRPSKKDALLNEAYYLSRLDHPNIIKYVEAARCKSEYWLILDPFCHLDLDCVDKLDTALLFRFMYKLAHALSYAHCQSVLHGDISWNNVRINRIYLPSNLTKYEPIWIDFGNGKNFHGRSSKTHRLGTPGFECPEPAAYGRKSDVYSLGVLFLFAARRHIGVKNLPEKQLRKLTPASMSFFVQKTKNHLNGKQDLLHDQKLLTFLIELAEEMTNLDYDSRPSSSEVVNRFIQSQYDPVPKESPYKEVYALEDEQREFQIQSYLDQLDMHSSALRNANRIDLKTYLNRLSKLNEQLETRLKEFEG